VGISTSALNRVMQVTKWHENVEGTGYGFKTDGCVFLGNDDCARTTCVLKRPS